MWPAKGYLKRTFGGGAKSGKANSPARTTPRVKMSKPALEISKLSAPSNFRTRDYNLPIATINAAGGVYINGACLLSDVLSGGTITQTVYAPVETAERVVKIAVTAPTSTVGAAVIPSGVILSFLGDDGDDAVFTVKNTSSVAGRGTFLVPPGSRMGKFFRALNQNEAAVEGYSSLLRLAENLLLIETIGESEENWILSVTFESTAGYGYPAIITMNPTAGLVGTFVCALDCIAPSGAQPPVFTVGSWLLTPLLAGRQALITKPAEFTRTLG